MKRELMIQDQKRRKLLLILSVFLYISPFIGLLFILPHIPYFSLKLLFFGVGILITMIISHLFEDRQVSTTLQPSPSFLSSPNFSDPDLKVAVDEVNALFPLEYYPNIPQLSYDAWEAEYENKVLENSYSQFMRNYGVYTKNEDRDPEFRTKNIIKTEEPNVNEVSRSSSRLDPPPKKIGTTYLFASEEEAKRWVLDRENGWLATLTNPSD